MATLLVLLLNLAFLSPTVASDSGAWCGNICTVEAATEGLQLLQAEAILHSHGKAGESVFVNTSKMDDRQQTTEAGGMRVVVLFVVLAVLCAISLFMYVKASMEDDDGEKGGLAQPHAARDDSSADVSPSRRREGRGFHRAATVIVAEVQKKHWTIDHDVETMSRFTFVVNMFADLCPPGMLALPSGLATTGFIPGFTMLLVFYGLCVYSMYTIGRTTEITGARDFPGQWSATFGPGTSWIPVVVVVVVCVGNCLAYSCFFADIFSRLMPSLGLAMPRSYCLFAFTLFPLLPLCLLKNLSALSNTSTFALVAVVYTAFVMVLRALDGSYAAGGLYFADVPKTLAPDVPTNHLFGFGMQSLSLVNGLAIAFLAHYNGCKYYRELERHTPKRLLRCTATSMGISVLLYMATMTAGFQTFGNNCDSVILANYSRNDWLLNVARLGIGLSIIASFPLMFSGLREAAIALLKQCSENASDWDVILRQDMLSMGLLVLITFLALVMTDTGIVVGLVGAICGSTIIYIVPCSLYAKAIQTFLTEHNTSTVVGLRLLIALGVALAVGGSYSTLFL
jgi:amino acid permease